VYVQAMRETMLSLAAERQQTQEPIDAIDRARRLSVCLQDLRRGSRDSRDQSALSRHGSERRKSVQDLVGNIDEGFTALSWLASSCFRHRSK